MKLGLPWGQPIAAIILQVIRRCVYTVIGAYHCLKMGEQCSPVLSEFQRVGASYQHRTSARLSAGRSLTFWRAIRGYPPLPTMQHIILEIAQSSTHRTNDYFFTTHSRVRTRWSAGDADTGGGMVARSSWRGVLSRLHRYFVFIFYGHNPVRYRRSAESENTAATPIHSLLDPWCRACAKLSMSKIRRGSG
jgi:hypothetical protein